MELSSVGCSMRAKFLDTSSELKSAGASLFSSEALRALRHPPLRLNTSRNPAYVNTICRVNGRSGKRRPPGKSVEQRQKEFAVRKEELLRKSRREVSVAERDSRTLGEEGNAALLLANGEGGAISVSVLQPIDEEYRPVATLSVRDSSRSRPNNAQRLDDIYLLNGFSKPVVQDAADRENGKESAAATFNADRRVTRRALDNRNGLASSTVVEHTVIRKVEQRQELASGIADDSSNSSADDDDEEWIDVNADEEDEDDDQDEEEEVEYWEGDLPPMTPEEEEFLLKEAEKELAELEKLGDAGKDPDLDLIGAQTSVNSERVEKERKLADLKALVQKMEEDLATEASENAHPTASITGFNSKKIEAANDEDDEYVQLENDEDDEDDEYVEEELETLVAEHQKPSSSSEIRDETKRVNPQHRKHHRRDYWELDGRDEDEDEEEVKEDRGVPAVMRCFDRAKVFVKAGDGGNGVVAFRREKFVPFGGPFGGNGGRGGQVYVKADSSMNSLLPFRKAVHFRAGRGAHGGGKRKEGAVGIDITVKVPPGTIVRESGPERKVLLELIKPGQCEMLLPGGAGGRGNAAFKTGRNNAPQLAEYGEQGPEMWIELELKLVADVGIVGVPNAGKSTLLSAVSAAKPEIANYPFTTLLPNLGVVALDYDATMVVADLPGLLEGAHTGIGLGHEFLRHTERCRVLVHVIDGMSSQPVEEFEAVRLELQLFNPILSEKPFVVAYNKMDVPEAADRWDDFQQRLQSKGVKSLSMSAATGQGSSEVMSAAHALLKEQKQHYIEEEPKTMAVAAMVRKQRSAPIEEFAIEEDKHTRTWQVTGAGLERFTQMTNWEYFESVRRFQRVLSASGVNKALREKGIREGDLVIVNEMEFNWIDSEDMSALADWKRGVRGSKVWPH